MAAPRINDPRPAGGTIGYIAFLRAVNVGGNGKLPMSTLVSLCEAAGFHNVRTYIASGNVLFRSDLTEDAVRVALQTCLHAHVGSPVGVIVRTDAEIASLLHETPFPDEPGNRVMALLTDAPLPVDPMDGVTGATNKQIRRGSRALYVFYPDGMATTRLRIPLDRSGTARNMNTIARLAAMTMDVL